MTEVERIAAELSEAQRRALLYHGQTQAWGGRNDDDLPNWSDAGTVLRNRWRLIDFISPTSSLTRLTPHGQVVRDHLRGQQS